MLDAIILCGAVAVAIMLVSVAFTARHHQRSAREEAMRLNYEAVHSSPAWQRVDAQRELAGDFVGGYTERLLPWWNDQEREAFGFNDTERFIREADLELGNVKPPVVEMQTGGVITANTIQVGPTIQEIVTSWSQVDASHGVEDWDF